MIKEKRIPFRIEWTAHGYEYKERGSDWFWTVGIVAVSLAIVSIIFGNIILAVLILVSAFSLALFINREPEEIEVVIDEKGVTKDRMHYPYETLRSFHIDIEHSHAKIMISSHKFFLPLIIIPLGDGVNVEKVHEVLAQFIEEEEHSLPLVENVLEFLGF